MQLKQLPKGKYGYQSYPRYKQGTLLSIRRSKDGAGATSSSVVRPGAGRTIGSINGPGAKAGEVAELRAGAGAGAGPQSGDPPHIHPRHPRRPRSTHRHPHAYVSFSNDKKFSNFL